MWHVPKKDDAAHVCIDSFCWVVTQACVCTLTHSAQVTKQHLRKMKLMLRKKFLSEGLSHFCNSEERLETFSSADCLWFVF